MSPRGGVETALCEFNLRKGGAEISFRLPQKPNGQIAAVSGQPSAARQPNTTLPVRSALPCARAERAHPTERDCHYGGSAGALLPNMASGDKNNRTHPKGPSSIYRKKFTLTSAIQPGKSPPPQTIKSLSKGKPHAGQGGAIDGYAQNTRRMLQPPKRWTHLSSTR